MTEFTGSPALAAARWRRIVDELTAEVATLPAGERRWIDEKLARIGALQHEMHALFLAAGGESLCADCLGECCGCGKHHVTLANLLAYLLRKEEPPEPEFSQSCPYMGPAGCRFDPSKRPYNCVSFLCEKVEERLAPAVLASFYRLDSELRTFYLAFERRYAGAGLRGVIIRAERLAGRPFLHRTEPTLANGD